MIEACGLSSYKSDTTKISICICSACYQLKKLVMIPGAYLRDQAFKLKPLALSTDLINQLKALAAELGDQAEKLQTLIQQGKNKNRHYRDAMAEAHLFWCFSNTDLLTRLFLYGVYIHIYLYKCIYLFQATQLIRIETLSKPQESD